MLAWDYAEVLSAYGYCSVGKITSQYTVFSYLTHFHFGFVFKFEYGFLKIIIWCHNNTINALLNLIVR